MITSAPVTLTSAPVTKKLDIRPEVCYASNMAKTNAERQRDWRNKRTGFSCWPPIQNELTMRRILVYIMGVNNRPVQASEVYRRFNGQRQKETWKWLLGEIMHNGWHGEDKLAPVTCRGSGRRGDPFVFQTSEEWDTERDWDKEQAEKAKAANEHSDAF